MHLVQLRIESLPGIEPGFTFEAPSQGVNVVTGPNAVGKSSLVRALGYLLSGVQREDPPALSLSAQFRSGETHLTVRRSGSQIVWTRDGETVTTPALPGADQIGLYRLSVESLLAGDRTDTELAAELQRRLRGGFDLDEPRTRVTKQAGRAEEKALRGARRELAGVEARYENLRRQEADLPELTRRVEKAESAAKESVRLHTAMRLYQAAEKRKDGERKLAEFPETLGRLKGDEVDRVDALETRSAELKRKLQAEQDALESTVDEHRLTGLAQARPTDEEVEVIDKCLQRMSVHRATRSTRRDALAKAERALQQAVAEFGGSGQAPRLEQESLRRGEAIAGPLIAARALKKELEQRIAISGNPPEEPEIDRLQRGARALRIWLADADRSGGGGSAAIRGLAFACWAALAAGLLAGGLSILLGASQAPEALLAGLAAAIAVFGTLFYSHKRTRAAPAAGDEARRAFEELGLAPPATWSASVVREHLRKAVEGPLQAMLLQRERAAGVKQLRVDLEQAAREVNDLEAQRQALGEQVGFDPALPLTALDRFLLLCMRLDEARAQRDACRTDLELIEGDIAKAGVRVAGFLDRWRLQDAAPLLQDGVAPDGDLLQASFDALRKRLAAAEAMVNRMGNGKRAIQALQQQVKEVDGDLRSLFDRAHLQRSDRHSMQQLVAQLEDWRTAGRALEQARGHENQLRTQLEDRPELIQLVEQGAAGELNSRLEAAESRAGSHTKLVEQRKEIETRLQEAGSESHLERALAAVHQAREALAEKLDQTVHNAATDLLLDDVEAAFQSQQQPQVLRRSDQLFSEATAHAFSLELTDDAFMARDKRSNGLKSLGQLSSGTRMQLLLALRLAWTEAQEQGGESLPLFLDEALTTSDENRFGVMANSLEKLAEAEGRQIFYLTARRHEAALWQDLTGSRPPVVDMAQLRFGEGARAAGDYRVDLPPSPPAPDGMSAEDYAAELSVPPLRPRLPGGTVHLFHLMRDNLHLLHGLMHRWHVGTVGQLEHLLRSSAAPGAVADAAMRTRLENRCRVLRTWLDLWRQGRGRPVDRGVLETSPAVSHTFIDRAADLAGKLKGDGRALVDALRGGQLRGFRSGKVEELETWLVAEGYIDEQLTLDADDRRRLALQRLAPGTAAAVDDSNEVLTWLEAAAL